MPFTISVTSTKQSAASGTLNKKLESLGYKVETIVGRPWATKALASERGLLDEATNVWHKRPFISPDGAGDDAEVVKVQFSGTSVRCSTVCTYLTGHTDRVIMINPDDPLHTKLFHFRLVMDLPRAIVTLVVDKPQITNQNFAPFFQVLQICLREFSEDDKVVQFRSRKNIGWAKRRYLQWLTREGKISPELKKLANNYMKSPGQEIGLLKKADTTWQHLVEAEKILQQGL